MAGGGHSRPEEDQGQRDGHARAEGEAQGHEDRGLPDSRELPWWSDDEQDDDEEDENDDDDEYVGEDDDCDDEPDDDDDETDDDWYSDDDCDDDPEEDDEQDDDAGREHRLVRRQAHRRAEPRDQLDRCHDPRHEVSRRLEVHHGKQRDRGCKGRN